MSGGERERDWAASTNQRHLGGKAPHGCRLRPTNAAEDHRRPSQPRHHPHSGLGLCGCPQSGLGKPPTAPVTSQPAHHTPTTIAQVHGVVLPIATLARAPGSQVPVGVPRHPLGCGDANRALQGRWA